MNKYGSNQKDRSTHVRRENTMIKSIQIMMSISSVPSIDLSTPRHYAAQKNNRNPYQQRRAFMKEKSYQQKVYAKQGCQFHRKG